MFKLVLVKTRRAVVRAGPSLGFLLFPFVCSIIMFQIPCAVVFRVFGVVALWLMFVAILSQVASRIVYNGRRLVVVTPFRVDVHPVCSIRHVSYQYAKLNLHFSFTLKLVSGKRKTYHFTANEYCGPPMYKIAEDVSEMLEDLMHRIGQIPPPRKVRANRHYDL